jgi:hypothetical protein
VRSLETLAKRRGWGRVQILEVLGVHAARPADASDLALRDWAARELTAIGWPEDDTEALKF